MVIDSLKGDATYRFLGAPERLLQEEKLALQRTSETYLQRLLVIWSSPLSGADRVQASNQLAMPVLSYFSDVVLTQASDRLARRRQAGAKDRV